ncbi:MAG: hypothetical protein H6713_15820 [Myxococcales bacterium]|nr:hypothetical protein [Myxococcales bacterium]
MSRTGRSRPVSDASASTSETTRATLAASWAACDALVSSAIVRPSSAAGPRSSSSGTRTRVSSSSSRASATLASSDRSIRAGGIPSSRRVIGDAPGPAIVISWDQGTASSSRSGVT